ncbi:MAG TPA: sugar-transfer associated ATP-grasp domain-containing protein [Dongiaceae bacterium]|nr:sugar-transfer associated ATP-grasp domain-containing protein [Dongiaceae bacterium]
MLSIIAVLAGAPPAGARADSGAAEPLGRMARRIFAAQRRSPYRQVHTHFRKNFWVRFNWLGNLGRTRSFHRRNAGAVTAQRGISPLRQAIELLKLAVLYGVDPATYYALHLYDAPLGLAETDYYVGRNEMKHGLYSLLRELRRGQSGYDLTLSEKAKFSEACRAGGLPAVPVLAVVSGGDWRFAPGRDAAALDGDLFVKGVRGKGAAGAAAYAFGADGLYRTRNGEALDRGALRARLATESAKRALLVTRRLRNHPEIADLALESLLTFRVFTCLDAAGRPVVTHAMLRSVSKLEPSWGTEEEFAAAIDVDTGRLGRMCGDANMAPDAWWDRHPKTGALVAGRVIENWPAVAALAVQAHEVFNGRPIIGWDLALAPEGPVVIEGNSDADTHFLQRVHRQTIGRSRMEPLLRRHLQAVEQVLAGKATFPSAA